MCDNTLRLKEILNLSNGLHIVTQLRAIEPVFSLILCICSSRPSRRFVPASERYPAALQRNRQESRLKRQAELLALQEKTRLPRTDPPPQNQEPRLCSNPTQTRSSPTRRVGGFSYCILESCFCLNFILIYSKLLQHSCYFPPAK